MLNVLKCSKTSRFLLILLVRGLDVKRIFEWKIDQKTTLNADIDFGWIFHWFWSQFRGQNRFKINPNSNQNSVWMRSRFQDRSWIDFLTNLGRFWDHLFLIFLFSDRSKFKLVYAILPKTPSRQIFDKFSTKISISFRQNALRHRFCDEKV